MAAERATRERLEASGAEREATVERVRASCEAHYTAARRRLEAELSAEHERLLQQAKQETLAVRYADVVLLMPKWCSADCEFSMDAT